MGRIARREETAAESLAAPPPDEPSRLAGFLSPHEVEQEVLRCLLSRTDVRFSSLTVRRFAGGVCLEGVVEVDDDGPDITDIDSLARRAAGVEQVLNRLVVQRAPAKG